jgi:hypothetical protein
MAAAAVTHAFNQNQRHVGCAITGTTATEVQAIAPRRCGVFLAVNQRVELYKKVCDTAGKRPVCHDAPVAEGVVTSLLNDHYSVVTFPAGTAFEETGYHVSPSTEV